VSAEVRPVVRVVTQQRIDAYADASGDHNPIHVDPEFARATPFGGTIAHGMLVLALIGEMMEAEGAIQGADAARRHGDGISDLYEGERRRHGIRGAVRQPERRGADRGARER